MRVLGGDDQTVPDLIMSYSVAVRRVREGKGQSNANGCAGGDEAMSPPGHLHCRSRCQNRHRFRLNYVSHFLFPFGRWEVNCLERESQMRPGGWLTANSSVGRKLAFIYLRFEGKRPWLLAEWEMVTVIIIRGITEREDSGARCTDRTKMGRANNSENEKAMIIIDPFPLCFN